MSYKLNKKQDSRRTMKVGEINKEHRLTKSQISLIKKVNPSIFVDITVASEIEAERQQSWTSKSAKARYHKDKKFRKKSIKRAKEWVANNREKYNEYQRDYYKRKKELKNAGNEGT